MEDTETNKGCIVSNQILIRAQNSSTILTALLMGTGGSLMHTSTPRGKEQATKRCVFPMHTPYTLDKGPNNKVQKSVVLDHSFAYLAKVVLIGWNCTLVSSTSRDSFDTAPD